MGAELVGDGGLSVDRMIRTLGLHRTTFERVRDDPDTPLPTGWLRAGMWLADGIALLALPRFVINHLRLAVQIPTALWPWQLLAITAGADPVIPANAPIPPVLGSVT